MTRSTAARQWLVGLVAWVGALGSGCTVDCELPICDIRDSNCHEAIGETVVCIRGGEPREIAFRVVDADAYVEEQVRAAEEDSSTVCTEHWYDALALYGLLSHDVSVGEAASTQLERVAAFYSGTDERVTVLDRGGALRGTGASLLLFHEMVHAFQDAEYDLSGLRDSVDASLAISAIVEGEAELYTDHAHAMSGGFDVEDLDWDRAYEAYRQRSFEDLLRATDPYLLLRSDFVYAYGVTYVREAWQAGGTAGVRALFEQPPLSTREIILGLDAPTVEDDPALVPDASPFLFEPVSMTRLGSYALAVALRRYWEDSAFAAVRDEPAYYTEEPPPAPDDVELELALTGDTFAVFAMPGSDAVLASWHLRFGTSAEAEAAAGLLRLRLGRSDADHGQKVVVSGTHVRAIASRNAPNDIASTDWEAPPMPDDPGWFDCGD